MLHTLATLAIILAFLFSSVTPVTAIALVPGDLLVVDKGKSATPGSVLHLHPISANQSVVSTGDALIGDGRGIAVDDAGRIFVVNSSTDSLVMIDPSDGSQQVISSGGLLSSPFDVEVDADGTLLIINSTPSSGLVRVDASDGSQQAISSGGLMVNPLGLALGPPGTALVAESTGQGDGGKILEVDLVSGSQQLIAFGQHLSRPYDLVLDSNETVLVAENGNGSIVRVNLGSGSQQVLSTGFSNIWGIAVDSSSAVLALDPNYLGADGALVKVDSITGNQTIFASGGFFSDPLRLAVVPVPEPGTAHLLLVGLAALVVRNKQQATRGSVRWSGDARRA